MPSLSLHPCLQKEQERHGKRIAQGKGSLPATARYLSPSVLSSKRCVTLVRLSNSGWSLTIKQSSMQEGRVR
eukprot:4925820-Amphidinium_carterae.1